LAAEYFDGLIRQDHYLGPSRQFSGSRLARSRLKAADDENKEGEKNDCDKRRDQKTRIRKRQKPQKFKSRKRRHGMQ